MICMTGCILKWADAMGIKVAGIVSIDQTNQMNREA